MINKSPLINNANNINKTIVSKFMNKPDQIIIKQFKKVKSHIKIAHVNPVEHPAVRVQVNKIQKNINKGVVSEKKC